MDEKEREKNGAEMKIGDEKSIEVERVGGGWILMLCGLRFVYGRKVELYEAVTEYMGSDLSDEEWVKARFPGVYEAHKDIFEEPPARLAGEPALFGGSLMNYLGDKARGVAGEVEVKKEEPARKVVTKEECEEIGKRYAIVPVTDRGKAECVHDIKDLLHTVEVMRPVVEAVDTYAKRAERSVREVVEDDGAKV